MKATSSLQDFVKEQKRSRGVGASAAVASVLGGTVNGQTIQSGLSDVRSKLSSGLSGLFGGGQSSSMVDGEQTEGLLNEVRVDDGGVDTDADNGKSKGVGKNGNGNGGSGSWSGLLRSDSDDSCGMSRTQRIVGFFFCLIAGFLCFGLASVYIPLLVFKARKFAALNTLGSCCFLTSFALLWGPKAYVGHLFSRPRLPVTAAYLTSVLATLYTSLWINSTLLTMVCASVQAVALVWFVLSYVPGGERGLRFMTGICTRFVKGSAKTSSLLPV